MKDIPTSPRIIEIRHKRRVKRMRLVILFFILLVFVIGGLAFFSANKNVVIDKIVVSGNHIIDEEDIEKEINKNISGRYIYLFSKNNSFIYPHKKIYDSLLVTFPRIEKLSIYRDNLKTLHIDISERTGSYLYCGENLPENKSEIGENCYFVNNDGFIFDKAPYFSGDVYFKYYMMIDNITSNPLGKQMLDIDHFHELARFIDAVNSIGFNPVYISLDQMGTYTLYLDANKGGTLPKIIFKDEDDFRIIQDNLSLAMKKKEFSSEINSRYDSLLYIDLRFKNKVLYKFQ
jgi:hypothetical protein